VLALPALVDRGTVVRLVLQTEGVNVPRVLVLVTGAVGTMWCAYAFAILALVALPSALKSGDPFQLVQWISQTFLQLVLFFRDHRRPEHTRSPLARVGRKPWLPISRPAAHSAMGPMPWRCSRAR
jgi:hypothetical protein